MQEQEKVKRLQLQEKINTQKIIMAKIEKTEIKDQKIEKSLKSK